MEFSSLVLFEKDIINNTIIRELGSYNASEGAEYITKMFYDGEKVNLYFDTQRDVEDWEYSAIFHLFDEDCFTKEGYSIEEIDSEFNPTWIVKLQYIEAHQEMEVKLTNLCRIIKNTMVKVFEDIKGKEEEYR